MNIVYPRTYRITYLPRRVPIMDVHDEGHAMTQEKVEPIVREIACHATREGPHFFHISIIKRYDTEHDTPVWLNVLSVPFDLLISCELVKDDSDHAVPMDALDLDQLVAGGPTDT
jgi:hypothetical protein